MSKGINKNYLEARYFKDKFDPELAKESSIVYDGILEALCIAAEKGKRRIKKNKDIKKNIPYFQDRLKEDGFSIQYIKYSRNGYYIKYYLISF